MNSIAKMPAMMPSAKTQAVTNASTRFGNAPRTMNSDGMVIAGSVPVPI